MVTPEWSGTTIFQSDMKYVLLKKINQDYATFFNFAIVNNFEKKTEIMVIICFKGCQVFV